MSVKYFEKPQLIAFACNAKRFAIVFLFFFSSPSRQCF